MKKKRIIAVHLLNDRSGSPMVFGQALDVLRDAGNEIVLYTATPSGDGFLSDVTGIQRKDIFYKWYPNKVATLVAFLISQLLIGGRLLFSLSRNDTVFVNTLLPFGAALAARLRGCTVVYYVHEVSIRPALLKWLLVHIMGITASKVLFVSKYTKAQTKVSRPRQEVVYNTLSARFIERASHIVRPNMSYPFTVLMLCSNKGYKGVQTFLEVARQLPMLRFVLVLSIPAEQLSAVEGVLQPPVNCEIHSVQTDTIPFYQQAHLVVNLSKPDQWVETFGLTILESMYAGRPVITPPVGGICELIEDGVEGYQIDSRNQAELVRAIAEISSNVGLYTNMAKAAEMRALLFSPERYRRQLLQVFADKAVELAHSYPNQKSTLYNS